MSLCVQNHLCRITQTTVKASVTSSKTTSLFVPFIPHCSTCWRGDPVNPIRDQRRRCSERGGDFDVSAAQILPVLPAPGPQGFQIKAAALLQRAERFAKKKKESLPEKKLTEHLGCVLEASPSVLAGSGSVAHADLLAVGAPAPVPLPGFPRAPAAGLKTGMLSPAQKGGLLLILMKSRHRTTEISAERFISL